MDNLQEHLQILENSLIVSLIASLLAWKLGYFHSLPKSKTSPSLTIWDLLGVFLVFLTVQLVVVPLVSLIWVSFQEGRLTGTEKITFDPITLGWLDFSAVILSATAIVFYFFLVNRVVFKAVWGKEAFSGKRRVLNDIKMGLLTWPIGYPIMLVCGQLVAVGVLFLFPGPREEQVAVKHLKMSMDSTALFIAMTIGIVFIVPVVEEVLFRGFLQNWLKTLFKRGYAIIITSIIFAFFHFSSTQGIDNIELVTSLFVFSCFLGFIYERQDSLWAPIGLHALFNAISVVLIILQGE